MTCLDPQVSKQTIIKGEDKKLNVRLVSADSGDPFDLTGATEIVAVLPATDLPFYLEKKLSLSEIEVASAQGGRMYVKLLPADTNKLAVDDAASFEIRVTVAGVETRVQLLQALKIVDSLFPTAP
jgi:hypothetical protein